MDGNGETFLMRDEPLIIEWSWRCFLRLLSNRKYVGGLRYGPPRKKQKYLTRMKKELKAYEVSGNMEQLLNIAVYCFLESEAPENKKFHFDNTVDSVTREN